MNKIAKISLITAGAIGLVASGGAIMHFAGVGNSKPDTSITIKPDISSGTTDVTKTYTSAQYLAMVSQYTKQIDGLKTELETNKEQYNQSVQNCQNEINLLKQEIETLGEENVEKLNEKNAKIDTLKAYIKTLEDEQNEKTADYENQISKLNLLLSNYEKEILKTIKLPSDFLFTSLGFQLIENNDFVFYSQSHSCKLYYYRFDTKTLETIPIKGTSFNAFYKLNNMLFFATSQMLYMYDFDTKEIKILGSVSSQLAYDYDVENLYIFDGNNGYGVLDLDTLKFDNNLQSGSNSVKLTKLDNYILHLSYGATDTNTTAHAHVRCFDTKTKTDYVVFDSSSDSYFDLQSFVKTSEDYFVCHGPSFYKFDTSAMEFTLIKKFSSSYSRCFVLEDKIFVFEYMGVHIYENSTVTQLTKFSGIYFRPQFYQISNDIYYFVSSGLTGLWKLDVTNKTLTQLSSSYSNFRTSTSVDKYALIGMDGGIYAVDMKNGTVENWDSARSGMAYTDLKTIDCGNYIIIYCYSTYSGSSYESYIYYYDKTNDVFGKIPSENMFATEYEYGFRLVDILYKNNLLYVMTDDTLYTFDLNASLTNCVSKLTVDASLSNLYVGVFYSKVAMLEGSKLYIKYTLLDDNTFTKDLVII